MRRALRIRFLFYQNFVWITFPISIFGSFLLWQSGTAAFVGPILFSKIMTNPLIGLMFHIFRPNQLYFFQNLGVSTFQLYASALYFDTALWLALLFITLTIL